MIYFSAPATRIIKPSTLPNYQLGSSPNHTEISTLMNIETKHKILKTKTTKKKKAHQQNNIKGSKIS